MSEAEYEFDIVLCILLITLTLVYVVLGFYSAVIRKKVNNLNERLERKSARGLSLLNTSIGCFSLALGLITCGFIALNYLSDGSRTLSTNKLDIISATFGVLGLSLIGFNYVTTTLLSIQAISLAENGIEATRKWWMEWLRECTGLIVLVVGISLIIMFLFFLKFKVFYFGIPIGLLLGTFYASLSYRLYSLSQGKCCQVSCVRVNSAEHGEGETDVKEPQRREKTSIELRCEELYRFTAISAVGSITASIECFFIARHYLDRRVFAYLICAAALTGSGMVVAFLHDNMHVTKRGYEDWMENEVSEDESTPNHIHVTTNTSSTNEDNNSIPPAPRPSWLPKNGAGLATVEPECWSISIVNWIKFVKCCMETDTWRSIAANKGDMAINMHDINEHFVQPWTRGTGCSIAGLMCESQKEVEVMISHAWGGSVKETLAAIQGMVSMYFIKEETYIFFCTMCLYQPEDGAQGGLKIEEALEKKPFAAVIKLNPKYGMHVIHTTAFELYSRLWCVHEVDECALANIKIFADFDLSRNSDKLLTDINTRNAECGPKDKKMLVDQIEANGGFDRLNKKIRRARQQASKDLVAARLFEQIFGCSIALVKKVYGAEI